MPFIAEIFHQRCHEWFFRSQLKHFQLGRPTCGVSNIIYHSTYRDVGHPLNGFRDESQSATDIRAGIVPAQIEQFWILKRRGKKPENNEGTDDHVAQRHHT